MPRPSPCTSGPCRSERRPWGRSTRTWPAASTTWPTSTMFREVCRGRAPVPAGPADRGEGPGAGAPGCGRQPQQPGLALLCPGEVWQGRAPVPAGPEDRGEDPGAGAPGRGPGPQQPGRHTIMPRGSMPRPSPCTSGPWRSRRKPWGRSTRMWPEASTTWPWSTDAQGRFTEAEPLYQRALKIREKALGPEHPDVAMVLENYAALVDQNGPGPGGRPSSGPGPCHPGEAHVTETAAIRPEETTAPRFFSSFPTACRETPSGPPCRWGQRGLSAPLSKFF